MAHITSQWWRRLENAYEVKACMVCLQCKYCVIIPYLSASEVSFLRWGAIQISVPLPFSTLQICVLLLLLLFATASPNPQAKN